MRRKLLYRLVPASVVAAAFAAGCAGAGSQGNVMLPGNGSGANGVGGMGNTVVRIFVPAGAQMNSITRSNNIAPPPTVGTGIMTNGAPIATPPITTPAPVAGSQALAINVSGPVAISQTVSVGPSASGCTPMQGGSSCQLALQLPAGTYTGTVGNVAVAFTVGASANNALNLTLGGVPSSLVVVPASSTSIANSQGGIDLYGAGRHPLMVEMLDANQNVMVGGGASFGLSQAGGSLPLTVSQGQTSANLFYVTPVGASNGGSAILRATSNNTGPGSPCALSSAVCSGTAHVDVRQILAVANSGSNSVGLFVNGQTAPLATIQNGVTSPLAIVFDAAGDLFVANQTGSVSEYVPPYNQSPITIAGGITHPQALAVDQRGNLFVANGSGSNTVTLYSPPYGGGPAATISSNVNDPVSLALDPNGDLFVVNAANNTVTAYAPPYTGSPTTISRGLNTPNSLALDNRGNLFVANLNSTPNSVVEYSPPFSNSSAPVATITNGVNEQGSITALSTNLFVPNEGANTVTEYTAPYTNSPTTIVGGESQPVALAIDALGNLYVANYGNNSITVYASPYAAGSWTTISNGVAAPTALALSPPTSGGAMLLP
jgi:hypothetical protein